MKLRDWVIQIAVNVCIFLPICFWWRHCGVVQFQREAAQAGAGRFRADSRGEVYFEWKPVWKVERHCHRQDCLTNEFWTAWVEAYIATNKTQ